jgi:hypothetical protein
VINGGATMVIMLDPDIEAALNELARKQGVDPVDLAKKALRERFLVPAPQNQRFDQWEQELPKAASDCGVSLSNEAVSSEGLYE